MVDTTDKDTEHIKDRSTVPHIKLIYLSFFIQLIWGPTIVT